MLGETDWALLVGATLLSAALSAVVGMAGGITLLSVMLLFDDPLVVIPLHGVVQLVANGSRTFVQRRHIRWEILLRYGVLALPMGFAGLAVARRVPPDGLKAAIGAFVLIATWRPDLLLLGRHPERIDTGRRFLLLGGVTGVLNVLIGATGPLISPFFLNLGLDRFALIGTKAACQAWGHLAKIIVFVSGGFVFAPHAMLLAGMVPAAVAGTWAGSRILERIDEKWFTRLYKGVLTVVAGRLVVDWLAGI